MKLAYSIKELCRATGLGKTHLYQRIAAGDLVRIKSGRRTLVTAESVDRMFDGLIHGGRK